MAGNAEIDTGYEALPSPQWVKDRSGVGEYRQSGTYVVRGSIERLFKLSG
jgi:hypothetical protein